MRTRVILSVAVMVLLGSPLALAQGLSAGEQVVTNENQLALVYSCNVFSLPIDPPAFRAWLIDPQFFWADFASLPAEFSAAFAESVEQVQGVSVLKLRLTRFILSGETLVEFPSSTNTLTLAAPSDYQTNHVDSASRSSLQVWRQYIEWGALDGDTEPTLRLDVALADIQDKPAYDAALAAADAACAEASAMSASSMAGIRMMDSEDSGSDLESLATYQAGPCGQIPVTSIAAVTNRRIALGWQSLSNASYLVQAYTNLEAFPFFSTLATVPSPGSQASYTDAPPSGVMVRFYRVLDASATLPCVSVTSPTNGAIISGLANVSFGAVASEKITAATLVVDGQPLWTTTNTTILQHPTWLLPNGTHTFAVQVVDDGVDTQGSATSPTVSVTVSNPVSATWYDAFGTTLPVQATLSYTSASWTVTIQDDSRRPLKTITGSTANGQIATSWDGTDSNGVAVADDTNYWVVVSATRTSAPNGQDVQPQQQGGTDTITWNTFLEPRSWASAQTIITRENLGSPTTWDPVALNKCAEAVTDVGMYADPQAQVWQGAQIVLTTATDWQNLLQALAGQGGRNTQFYFTGHANANGIGQQNHTTPWLDSAQVQVALRNLYYFSQVDKVPIAHFHTPYKFVFLDACLSGNGDWPHAFGILRNQMDYTATTGRKQRAFMGWSTIQFQGFFSQSTGYPAFTINFWNAWVANSETAPLQTAVNSAMAGATGVNPNSLVVYGFTNLQWGD